MLSTAKRAEEPDERQILPSQLTTPTAADYLSSAPPLSLSVNQTANRLGTFLTNWNLFTTNKWILQAVSGYKIPFLRPPHQWRDRPTVFQEGQPTELMKGEIQSLISKGAISVVNPFPQQFISTLFLVEKGQGTGEFCPLINLKAPNRFLPKEKFKMEGLHTARSRACNGTSTGGRWSVEEAEQHINCLERKAAILALKAFLRVAMKPPPQSLGHHHPRHILLEMDNTTAVAYVNRRGAHSHLLCPY